MLDRAIQSRELRRSIGRLDPKELVLKVAGKEEYLLEEKSISSYQVRQRGLVLERGWGSYWRGGGARIGEGVGL